MSNCKKCGVQLTKIEDVWDDKVPNLLHRHVFCNTDPLLGGCGNDFWYTKQYNEATHEEATKVVFNQKVVQI